MEGSFEYLVKNLDSSYQPYEWELYTDLIDTKNNLEDKSFYNWDLINSHYLYQDIKLLLNDFNNNINIIIDTVKQILIDFIKEDNRFNYINDENIIVKQWHLDDLICCGNCGNIWDGFAQCNCGY